MHITKLESDQEHLTAYLFMNLVIPLPPSPLSILRMLDIDIVNMVTVEQQQSRMNWSFSYVATFSGRT